MSVLTPLALAAIAFVLPQQQDSDLRIIGRDVLETDGGNYQAEMGTFSVLENRQAADSRRITLSFARLKCSAAEAGPPLFVLPGGPGLPAIHMARSAVWGAYLELGDVILLDPRGCGRSEPNLVYQPEGYASEHLFTDRETAVNAVVEGCKAAAEHYRSEGVDLSGYNTIQMAEDVDELRAALGYERINILGHSFGTHLGLAILRAHPERVARFVSAGTAGTNHMMKLPGDLDESLAQLSDLVAADPLVGEAMPDFTAAFEEAIRSLEQEPLPVPVRDPKTGEIRDALLGPYGLKLIILMDLQDTNDLPVFPRLVHSILERDPSMVRWFLQKRIDQLAALPIMMFSVRAASGASEERWVSIRKEAGACPFGMARCLFSPEIDQVLGVGDVGVAFRKPVQSDIPTLFISGSFDAATPPHQAELVREGFPNSGHLVVQFSGHDDLLPDPRVQERIVAFLAGADPKDELLDRPILEFAPLSGPVSNVSHPALGR